MAESKKIFYANKKYKVGIFSQHLWILVSLAQQGKMAERAARAALFYAVKLRLREKYAKLLSLLRIEKSLLRSIAAQGIKASHTSREAIIFVSLAQQGIMAAQAARAFLFECVKQGIQESIRPWKRYQPSQPLSLYRFF